MPQEPEKKPADPKAAEPETAKEKKAKLDEQEVGDFIRRNVLEKDSVFFEG